MPRFHRRADCTRGRAELPHPSFMGTPFPSSHLLTSTRKRRQNTRTRDERPGDKSRSEKRGCKGSARLPPGNTKSCAEPATETSGGVSRKVKGVRALRLRRVTELASFLSFSRCTPVSTRAPTLVILRACVILFGNIATMPSNSRISHAGTHPHDVMASFILSAAARETRVRRETLSGASMSKPAITRGLQASPIYCARSQMHLDLRTDGIRENK